jgi:tetratricopeptide (TPR) repeat protein
MQHESATARALVEESLTLARQLGDRWWTAWALHMVGRVAYFDNDSETATSFGQESLALAREIQDDWLIAWALHLLALAAYIAEDYPSARRYFDASLTIRRELGYPEGIGLILSLLATVDFREGNYIAARATSIDALQLQREVNSSWVIGSTYANLAPIAVALGDPRRGARISGAAREIHESVNIRPIPIVAEIYEPALEEMRRVLGEAAFAAEQQRGRRLSLDDVISEALAIEVSAAPDQDSTGPLVAPSPQAASSRPDGLSAREVRRSARGAGPRRPPTRSVTA